jgi:hypothetical protein
VTANPVILLPKFTTQTDLDPRSTLNTAYVSTNRRQQINGANNHDAPDSIFECAFHFISCSLYTMCFSAEVERLMRKPCAVSDLADVGLQDRGFRGSESRSSVWHGYAEVRETSLGWSFLLNHRMNYSPRRVSSGSTPRLKARQVPQKSTRS